MATDPAAIAVLAGEATELARSLGDADLEIVGLSALGLGLVCEGRVADGMARLDEAMVAATGGELKSLWSVSDVYCNTLLACERAGDFEQLLDGYHDHPLALRAVVRLYLALGQAGLAA
ncbi:MAG: hypothetical protein ACR2HY_06395 [Acidimicrobiales bacterium]